MENKIVYLDITSIGVNPMNPRKTFDSAALGELADSIKEVGVLQPITVRTTEGGILGETYQLVCGERRWRAAAMAGLTDIPAIIRELSDDEAMDVAITENLQRKDVAPMEEADAFKYLLDKRQCISDLCARFGKSEFYIRGRLKLLSISDDFRKLLDCGDLSISQAMEIVKFDGDVQGQVYEDHFKKEIWNSWLELRPSVLYQRIVDGYTKELDHYNFDKSDCENCADCTKNSCLFADMEAACCQNSDCLKRKDVEHKVILALKLQNQHPEASFVVSEWNKDCATKVELETLGNEVTVIQTGANRIGAVTNKELKKRIEEGTAILVIYIQDTPYLGYVNKDDAGVSGSDSATIKKLRDKDKRNAEIFEEKTVSDVREAIKNMDAEALSSRELTDYESQLTLFTLIRTLKKEQQEKLGLVKYYTMSDEEAWNVVMSITPKQIAFIYRCNILNQVGDHTQKDFKTDLFFDWVNDLEKSVVPSVELKHKEVYLRRKERIDARIAEIEMSKEEA